MPPIFRLRENGDSERHDKLLALLRWLERTLLEVAVFEQDSAPPAELTPATVNRWLVFGY